jgi:hypothetical protein
LPVDGYPLDREEVVVSQTFGRARQATPLEISGRSTNHHLDVGDGAKDELLARRRATRMATSTPSLARSTTRSVIDSSTRRSRYRAKSGARRGET